jgi:hypothetical protein
MRAFSSVPIVFAVGLEPLAPVEYQLMLHPGDWLTVVSFGSLREAVRHARYDEVNFRSVVTRILVHLPARG